MKRDLIPRPTAPTWELVDEVPPMGKLTADELKRMQGFTAPYFTTESPPCAHFAIPQKSRLA